jgi:hypothetical protein
MFGGRAARDVSIAVVEKGANERWKGAAMLCVMQAAKMNKTITSDDVWALLSDHPVVTRDGRAMGPVMLAAGREGWIEHTEEFRQSRRTSRHAAPLRVWRSLIVRG